MLDHPLSLRSDEGLFGRRFLIRVIFKWCYGKEVNLMMKKLKLIGIGLSILGGLVGIADAFVKDKALDEKVEKAVEKVLPKN